MLLICIVLSAVVLANQKNNKLSLLVNKIKMPVNRLAFFCHFYSQSFLFAVISVDIMDNSGMRLSSTSLKLQKTRLDANKKAISEYLDSAPTIYRDEFDRIRDFMNSGASTDGFMTRMKIADLDRKREQNFAVTCPEMAQLINYEFTFSIY